MKQAEALGDRVLIKRRIGRRSDVIFLTADTKDTFQKSVLTGAVVMVGPEVEHVKPGDIVTFSQYAGQEVYIQVDWERDEGFGPKVKGRGKVVFDLMREKDVLMKFCGGVDVGDWEDVAHDAGKKMYDGWADESVEMMKELGD